MFPMCTAGRFRPFMTELFHVRDWTFTVDRWLSNKTRTLSVLTEGTQTRLQYVLQLNGDDETW